MTIRSLQYLGPVAGTLLVAACTQPNKWPFDELTEAGVSPDRSDQGRDAPVGGASDSGAVSGGSNVKRTTDGGLSSDGGGGASGANRDGPLAGSSVPKDTVTVAVEVVPPESGGVRVEPIGVTCTATCSFALPRGLRATITAVPTPTSVFTGWAGDGAGSEPCQLDLSSDRRLSANFAPRGSVVWNLPLEEAQVNALVLVDDAVFAAGQFSGSLVVAGQDLRTAGDWDAFLAEVGPDGSPRWAKRFGGPKTDYFQIAAFLSGELLVGGVFADGVDFGGGPMPTQAGALANFSRSGGHGWGVALLLPPVFVLPVAAGYLVGTTTYTFYGYTERLSVGGQRLGSPLGTPQALTSGTAHPAGGYVVGGWIREPQNIMGRAYVPQESDPFVGRFTSAGTPVWAAAFTGPDHESINHVDVDARGDVYVVGRFDSALTIDDRRYQSAGRSGVFLIKMGSADGRVLWKKVLVDTEYQKGCVMVDGETVLWGGTSRSPPELGGPPLPPGPFLARFTLAGAHEWSAPLDSEPHSLAVGPRTLYVGRRGGLTRLVP